MLTPTKKAKTIKKTRKNEDDTGSAEVQIGLLTERIKELSAHLKKHTKDKHSRRGLLQMVADRRKHLKYLENKNPEKHATVLKELKLK